MSHNSSTDSWLYEDGYSAGEKAGEIKGTADEQRAILEWIEEHRTVMEVEAGINAIRDHFSSEDLVSFIKGRSKK